MLRRSPLHHVKQVRTRLKRAHHPSCSLIEHPVGNMVKKMALELKVDNEINMSSCLQPW